jgi:hypothetical protein
MSSSKSEGTSGKKDTITKARIRDLEFYLGSDWLDWSVITGDIVIELYRSVATSSYQPKQCPKCKEYWHTTLSYNGYQGRALKPVYLSKTVFGNIPCIKEDCWKCSK